MLNSDGFAKRLESVLDFYGLTATSFAEQIDFSRSSISHILSGRNKPSLDFVIKVLEKFPEVTFNWIVNGKGSFPSSENKTTIISEKNEKPDTSSKIQPDSFSEKKGTKKSFLDEKADASNKIERIVVFYVNGGFKAYEN